MMRAPILATLLLLGACAGLPPGDALTIACRGYEQTLRNLAVHRQLGNLSNEQIAAVDRVRPVLNAACQPGNADPRTALDTVERALIVILTVEKEAQR